jgi:acetyl esterase/lipase
MAPEAKFPAASEDLASVYRALLAHYRPENIGLYGCSAGGILTAEAVAWFGAHNLPRPGAIVSECGTGAELEGDSGYVAALTMGQPIPPGSKPLHLTDLPYFQGVDPKDPLVFPIVSRAVLAKFPPTLLLAGSRDFAASSLTMMHRRLHAAGVESELYLFDGLPHAFMMDSTLPESAEADDIVCDFFDRHLGRGARR